jgi:hypothetical protein
MSERSERTSKHSPIDGCEAALSHLSAAAETSKVTTREAL